MFTTLVLRKYSTPTIVQIRRLFEYPIQVGSRECFWDLISQENAVAGKTGSGERILFLPESVEKSHKIWTVSGEIAGTYRILLKRYPKVAKSV
jgi:hypothetical protein